MGREGVGVFFIAGASYIEYLWELGDGRCPITKIASSTLFVFFIATTQLNPMISPRGGEGVGVFFMAGASYNE